MKLLEVVEHLPIRRRISRVQVTRQWAELRLIVRQATQLAVRMSGGAIVFADSDVFSTEDDPAKYFRAVVMVRYQEGDYHFLATQAALVGAFGMKEVPVPKSFAPDDIRFSFHIPLTTAVGMRRLESLSYRLLKELDACTVW
jgi:hypothetical protein